MYSRQKMISWEWHKVILRMAAAREIYIVVMYSSRQKDRLRMGQGRLLTIRTIPIQPKDTQTAPILWGKRTQITELTDVGLVSYQVNGVRCKLGLSGLNV